MTPRAGQRVPDKVTFFVVLHDVMRLNVRLVAQWLQPVSCPQHLGGKIDTTFFLQLSQKHFGPFFLRHLGR